jgi:L-serine dehydratase
MRKLGSFDIIGPTMIGPSSSHTAGALRIALMAKKIAAGRIVQTDFTLYGSFAKTYKGHGTDKALIAGILGMETSDEAVRTAPRIACQAGIVITFATSEEAVSHPNTVGIRIKTSTGKITTLLGESIGGGAFTVRKINDVDVELTGEYNTILVRQHDAPGILARIAQCVATQEVNIATTRMYREKRDGSAYTVLETDQPVPQAVIEAIRASEGVVSATLIEATSNPTLLDDDLVLPSAEEADFTTGAELLAHCLQHGTAISEEMLTRECTTISTPNPMAAMSDAWTVMHHAITNPLLHPERSMGGLIGGEAHQLATWQASNEGLCGPVLSKATVYALAALETNASMGVIVAAPTAGGSGSLPGVLAALQETHGFSDEQVVKAMFCAAAVGYLVARNANVSGAEGGCQAEVGVGSAMASAAAVELMGGSPEQCLSAASTALSNILGLVCDPVCGLVEVPCQKRNAMGVANALVCAEMALAGLGNIIPFDEIVDALQRVGAALPHELRETALGGLATTPTACSLCNRYAK